MHGHLRIWLAFLERKVLNRPLAANEYIFPVFAPNGLVHAHKSINHNLIQKYINEFALGAGILTEYSTHCFRRGGAQYRFMYAPIGEQWPLVIIRWWKGWAEGENVRLIHMLGTDYDTFPEGTAPPLLLPGLSQRTWLGDSPVRRR